MLATLRDVVTLMQHRYQRAVPAAQRTAIFVVIDELAEVLKMGGDLLESNLSTILQKGRAARIHVIASTPKADTTHLGTLASFFNGRVVMKTVRPSDAYLAAGASSKAHRLGLKGDMYVGPEQRRVQGFRVLPEDVPDLLGRWLVPGGGSRLQPTVDISGTGTIGVDVAGGVVANLDGLLAPTSAAPQPPEPQPPTQQPAAPQPPAPQPPAQPVEDTPPKAPVSRQMAPDVPPLAVHVTAARGGGRPTKPITDTELTALKAYVTAVGHLPSVSQLVKGGFAAHPAVRPILAGDERYSLGMLGRGCLAQTRAERLLKLGVELGLVSG